MSTPHEPDSETISSPEANHTSALLHYVVTHIFLPVQLPYESDYTLEKDLSLCRAVCAAAHAYGTQIHESSEPRWNHITRMLDNLQASVQSEHLGSDCVVSQLRGMRTGDILTFLIRPHNSAVMLTKRDDCTLFEFFEVPPRENAIEETAGPLICQYPRHSVEIPHKMFDDVHFQFELASSLCHHISVGSEHPSPCASHDEYVTALFSGILRDVGRTADFPHIVKHVRDEVPRSDDHPVEVVWRRSSLWLLVRIVIQMSFDRSIFGCASYKAFVLFFICTIARDPNIAILSTDLLHLMACKILRRLGKLRSSIPAPEWLSEVALETCAGLREILDARCTQPSTQSSPFRNPSQDELARDTQLSMQHSREYISNALANQDYEFIHTPFHPNHPRRGTIVDFLSSNGAFFDQACDTDRMVALYDMEQSVENGIDEWVACVANVIDASVQLEDLMDKYMKRAHRRNPEDESIMLLTAIELFVALDKLVVKEIPILADYSPEIPLSLLERLLLCRTTSLHRLSCAYQYLSSRHSRSHPGWSLLSNEFTKDSFAVRYYDMSPHHQQLNARIEQDTMVNGVSRSPLPALTLHAKVVVFELQCPTPVHSWRSAVARLWHYACNLNNGFDEHEKDASEEFLLSRDSTLQRYIVDRDGPRHVQFQFAYLPSQRSSSLCYAVRYPRNDEQYCLSIWPPRQDENLDFPCLRYRPRFGILRGDRDAVETYMNSTSHTPNDILAAQAKCSPSLLLDELVAFGQLRSGGSLQWVNILRGLRSRTLSLRHLQSHFLLTSATYQVGPLDLDTGTWIWHQELHDPLFCTALLDELENLFADTGTCLIDGVMMNTMSLLFTRLLASSPSDHVSKRIIILLQKVRRKTFKWMQELSYNLAKAPMNSERRNLLLRMALTCRSTFNVDSGTLHKQFHSAEDVDAALSCFLLIHALPSRAVLGSYLNLLLRRDDRLSFALEGTLRNLISADASDYGIDLAVCKIFPSHKPGSNRWEQLQCPNHRWLTCSTNPVGYQPSQTTHLNLLDGELRMDGQLVGGLPHAIRDNPQCEYIFHDQGFFVIPSSLPGMSFTTLTMTSKHRVHFSIRNDDIIVRVQSNESKDILHLVPSSKLKQDLPPVLVDDCVHWLNLSTRIIEIRPLKRLWEQSPENWRIDCASGKHRAYKDHEALVDICSPTMEMVSSCFGYLNIVMKDSKVDRRPERNILLVTASSVDSFQGGTMLRLSVSSSCYGLSFFVNQWGELESHDFKDMVYDENRCIGTFPGLDSKLVLRQRAHLVEGFINKRVLIPTGALKKQDNQQVWVVRNSRNSRYRTYHVDTELGCLIGDGSLPRTLEHLVELHIMTSCDDRPDPLTGKTGAQAAFCLSQSAGFKSVTRLDGLYADIPKSQYPQINASYKEIKKRRYWNRDADLVVCASEKRAEQRAAFLFPWKLTGSTSLHTYKDGGNDHLATHIHTASSNELTQWQITLQQLLYSRSPPELPSRTILLCGSRVRPNLGDTAELDQLLSSLPMNNSRFSFRQEYIALLQKSEHCVHQDSRVTYRLMGGDPVGTDALAKYFAQCRVNYLDALCTLRKTLGPAPDPYEQGLGLFGQWPPITADILLRCLASTSLINPPRRWKKCLTSLALLLLDFQRARRLSHLALDGLEEELSKEVESEGCDGWDPDEFPDWLLIQVQGNFLIRRHQVQTAMEMISPQSGGNTVMQVNMGEGKSSVIIPIAAAALANGKQLVRVIVPKPLTVQMFELLIARLGGLANRPIYHLPFSRSHSDVETSLQIDDLQKLMSQCMAERGVLLVQPEHVVSLRLKSVEEQLYRGQYEAVALPKLQASIYKHITTTLSLKLLSKDSVLGNIFRSLNQLPEKVAQAGNQDKPCRNTRDGSDSAAMWLNLQMWTDSHVRDILDESDEILHPRFQLIYTVGPLKHMDGYPDRWTITQQVLRLVKECADILSRHHPNSMEYNPGPLGSFPHIRIIPASDVGQRFKSFVVEEIMAGRLPSVNVQRISDPELQRAIRSFISDENVLQIPDTVKKVEEYAKRSEQSCLWSGLLLLRGLLASNILLFALSQRRWRVDYGLSLQREDSTMLAVPYRAKDMPAPNTQFGHPDITIILTCLSYYYGGLSEEKTRTSFEILLDEDDPSTEYALWVKDYNDGTLPDSLRTLGEINLKSSEQWEKIIFPLFSRNQAAIDFYLSRVVFPKEAKEYPLKLSASCWDLAQNREKFVTGFSGTNDGQWLLPMSIVQHDLDHQMATNARVLTYLLRPENNFYMATNQNGERRTTHEFLRMVVAQRPEIRVLLDVAKTWLDIVRNASGAVYFNQTDELMVLTRNGDSMPMSSSPLSHQLERCVVYLDHAHTRGTDLKLPVGSRAAIMLGPKLTKVSLVQGCMRMRKLGHGHSVMFFAPLEVDLSIRALTCKKDPKATVVNVLDILCWAIHETWNDIEQRAPYWAQQGMNHKSRKNAWSRFCKGDLTPEQLSDAWLQPELKSLEDLYTPRETKDISGNLQALDPGIRQRCKDLGVLSLANAQMEEEQAREVNRERERERETELPPIAEPAEHFLHPDVVAFVKTGFVPLLHPSSAFRPIFTTLEKSTAATRESDVWSPFILATTDFCNTIKPESTRGTIDQYLCPVQWILSSAGDCGDILVLISPFEANRLLPDIRVSDYVHLHVYAPRTSRQMKPSDDLKLYSIPPLSSDWTPPWALIDQLNVFAGQLYLRDYDAYIRLCRFLGEPVSEQAKDPEALQRNVFRIPGSFEENEITFSCSPLPAVMALLAIRNRGRPFTHTHMGKILHGEPLARADFEEPQSAASLSRTTTTCDEEAMYAFASETIFPSPLDMECDPEEGPGPSLLPPPSKRKLETVEISSNADPERRPKRPRSDL